MEKSRPAKTETSDSNGALTSRRQAKLIPLLTLVCACSLWHAFGQTQVTRQTDEAVVRVSTNLVTVPVAVLDRNGRFIPDLTIDQFHIYEDGVEQKIVHFDSAEKPFTLALMLDVSDSARFKLKEIQDAAAIFVKQLHSNDRVMIVAFDRNVTILSEPASDRTVVTESIYGARTGGGTSLYNALDVVMKQRLSRIAGRKAIVLFTDGVDTTSAGASYASTLREAQELDALVYAIQYDTYSDRAGAGANPTKSQTAVTLTTRSGELLNLAYTRATRYLRLLTQQSGGRFYYADSPAQLARSFARIAAELRQQYALAYYPTSKGSDSQKREIRVRVAVPNVVVRARKSYIHRAKQND